MKIYHATHRDNVTGCLRAGMKADLATGRTPAVWGCTRQFIEAAVLHAANKRKVRLRDIVVLELDVPRKWVKRFCVPGMVYVPCDVPRERVSVYARVYLK